MYAYLTIQCVDTHCASDVIHYVFDVEFHLIEG